MSPEAFILMGGKSSRMGRDKALVEIDGVSLAERTLRTMKATKLFSRITFVAGHEAAFAMPAVQFGAPFIFDIYPGRGPLSGMHTALADVKTEWIFVTACDYPFTTPELIKLLAGRISNDHGAVIPEQPDGLLQPLFAFYKVETLKPIIDEIVERQRAARPMRDMVMNLEPVIVRPPEYSHLNDYERLFSNVNTPNDLADAVTQV